MHIKFGTLESVLKDKWIVCGTQFLSMTVVINWCNWTYRKIISIAYFTHSKKTCGTCAETRTECAGRQPSRPGSCRADGCASLVADAGGRCIKGLQGTLIQMFLLRFQQHNKNRHGYLFRCFSSSQKSSLRARASWPCAAVPAATAGPFSLIDAHEITTQDLSSPPPTPTHHQNRPQYHRCTLLPLTPDSPWKLKELHIGEPEQQ